MEPTPAHRGGGPALGAARAWGGFVHLKTKQNKTFFKPFAGSKE